MKKPSRPDLSHRPTGRRYHRRHQSPEHSGWHGRHAHPPHHWQGKPPFLFLRFLIPFGMMALLVVGGMGAMAFVLTRLLGAPGSTAILVWLSGCSLALALPALALWLAISAFRRIARPLADVMAAADAVAEGDLSTRVSEEKEGEFRQLARSFNRMATQLELADQQRRNLTADVAHELRTPLHIIQGNLEGVLDGVYEPTADHIRETLEETELLGRLVEDLRTLSLAESGHLPLHKEPLDLQTVLEDVRTTYAGPAESAAIGLHFEGEKRPLPIHGDADRLTQAFGNILNNALRHTPSGGTVRVLAQRVEDAVEIRFSDSGAGLDEGSLPFVFDRFWKGDKSRAGAGTGLGLAITKQFVLAHGGTIEVESTPGEGATFIVTLPLVDKTAVDV